jgi:predicted Fe-Mo cluster-binding NifX family protein
MRVAISADNNQGLDSVVSPHFGRCPYFILVDLEDRSVENVQGVDNPFYSQHRPGQVPGFINNQDVDVMLTGGMGGRAIGFFRQYGIQAVTGAYGTVRHALEQYLGGELQGAAPCRESVDHGCAEIPPGETYEEDEVGRLREEADMLQQQLEQVETRLQKLEGKRE